MGFLADLTDEVGEVAGGELCSATGLVGPLSVGKGLPLMVAMVSPYFGRLWISM